MSEWERTLSRFRSHLEEQRAALGDGRGQDLTAFSFPPGLVPAPLRDAALALLDENRELEATIAVAMDTLARARGVATRSSRAGPPAPRRGASFFDGRA